MLEQGFQQGMGCAKSHQADVRADRMIRTRMSDTATCQVPTAHATHMFDRTPRAPQSPKVKVVKNCPGVPDSQTRVGAEGLVVLTISGCGANVAAAVEPVMTLAWDQLEDLAMTLLLRGGGGD